MMMRITWGKLHPGTWDKFEQKYKETLAGKEIKGVRRRWLAQDASDPDGGFFLSLWKPQRTYTPMSKARDFETCMF